MDIIYEEKQNQSKKEKPFNVFIDQENKGESVKTSGIKPFNIDKEYASSKMEEIVVKLPKDQELNGEIAKFRPFNYISEEVAQVAENFCQPLKISFGDVSALIPYIGQAFEDYKRSGGEIPSMVPVLGTASCNCGLNFRLILNKVVVRIFDTAKGETGEYSYDVTVSVFKSNGKTQAYNTIVKGDKIKSTEWIKRATQSLAKLPSSKEEKQEFQNMVQICIEKEGVPMEVSYPTAGWRNVTGIGWRYVYQDGIVGDSNSFVHTTSEKYGLSLMKDKVGSLEAFQLAQKMQYICRNEAASTELFLFVHASTLTTLFEKAGYPLNFIFGIAGVTNSRKTSLVLAMAKLFDREKLIADAEFATATGCGIEKALGTYHDAPVLIDDFKPGANRMQQKEMDRKLDELARYYGNRVPKQRMTDFMIEGDKKYFPIGGGCVLTMEIVTGVTSSISRMFITELGYHDVINERLQFYQDNRWILPTYFYDFLVWVTGKFEEVVLYIREGYPIFRQKHKFDVGRYAEMYATMMVTGCLITEFAKERQFWGEIEAKEYLERIEKILLLELKVMEHRLRRRDKGVLVIDAITDALKNHQMVPVALNVESCSRKEPFYEDEQFYYFRAKDLRKLVNTYCQAYQERREIINEDELIGVLEKQQVLDIIEKDGKRQRSRKLPIQRGNTQRYLYLNKKSMCKLSE